MHIYLCFMLLCVFSVIQPFFVKCWTYIVLDRIQQVYSFYYIGCASMNCRVLADKIKRLDVFNYFRNKKICLQDIHIEQQQNVDKIRTEWGFESVFSPFKSNARGVAILFNNTFDFKIKKTELDREGNFAIAHIETMEKFITITNIYGPNRDSPDFYSSIKNRMEHYNDTSHIMCGDFILVLDPTKDY